MLFIFTARKPKRSANCKGYLCLNETKEAASILCDVHGYKEEPAVYVPEACPRCGGSLDAVGDLEFYVRDTYRCTVCFALMFDEWEYQEEEESIMWPAHKPATWYKRKKSKSKRELEKSVRALKEEELHKEAPPPSPRTKPLKPREHKPKKFNCQTALFTWHGGSFIDVNTLTKNYSKSYDGAYCAVKCTGFRCLQHEGRLIINSVHNCNILGDSSGRGGSYRHEYEHVSTSSRSAGVTEQHWYSAYGFRCIQQEDEGP